METVQIYSPNGHGSLVETFEEMKEAARKRRKTKTPKSAQKVRKGKDGKSFTYVNGDYAQKWLDDNYPGSSWEVDPDSVNNIGNNVHVAGTLTLVEKSGVVRRIKRYGSKEAILNSGTGQLVTHPYLKSAETDALKRCLAFLGMANDIYGSGIEAEEKVAVCDPNDIRWFAEQMPTILASLPPEKLHIIPVQFTALAECEVTKERLVKYYADKHGIILAQ